MRFTRLNGVGIGLAGSLIAGLLLTNSAVPGIAAAPGADSGPTVLVSAARPDFQLPFSCGQQWRLDTWAHAPALDMVREPNQQGTEGNLVVASASGVVKKSFYHENNPGKNDGAGNVIQVDHGGGWFTTYLHLQSRSVKVGQKVDQGQEIGHVGKTGKTSNGHPHLHFEQAFDRDGNGDATWGVSNSERVPAILNGDNYGGENSKTWRNVTSHNNCKH